MRGPCVPHRTGDANRPARRGQPLGPRRQGRAERAEDPGGKVMSRIAETFARIRDDGRGGLVAYVTAGDPERTTSEQILLALAEGGADLIEVGVPFSDPVADGPVIQRATERALAAGMTLRGALDLVERVRSKI